MGLAGPGLRSKLLAQDGKIVQAQFEVHCAAFRHKVAWMHVVSIDGIPVESNIRDEWMESVGYAPDHDPFAGECN